MVFSVFSSETLIVSALLLGLLSCFMAQLIIHLGEYSMGSWKEYALCFWNVSYSGV